MSPLPLALVGVCFCALGLLALRRIGSGYRIGRTLMAAQHVAIADLPAAVVRGEVYVRVHGRITSDEEFPEENDRPLVYRRRRLELAEDHAGRRWQTIEDEVHAVPFGLEERGAYAAVDAAQLGEGLVVIVRESVGTAADAPDRVPPGTPPGTPLRHRIHQVSAVEQAYVAGAPAIAADGTPTLTAGAGRPLILATLELDEAMRLLAAGHRSTVTGAAFAFVAGLALIGLAAILVLKEVVLT